MPKVEYVEKTIFSLEGVNVDFIKDGKNVRDYIYIDDLCDCCYRLIEDNVVNEIFNIGSGKGYSNSEIISIINDISLFILKIVLQMLSL